MKVREVNLLKEIESLGYEAYIVGGAVRDLLMGSESSDIDIATNCPMETLEANFRTHNVGTSKQHGTLVVLYEGDVFEVTQFRKDGDYSDGRHPDSIETTSDFREDAKRRDFTINALGMTHEGEVIDHVNGMVDIKDRIVRCVGDPNERFAEDHLRMVRAARFASLNGFVLDKHTRIAARKHHKKINTVSRYRLVGEIKKAADGRTGGQFVRFLLHLDEMKLLSQLMPELVALKFFRHDLQHHPEGPTVFDHCIKCVEILGADTDYITKMAVLLHDVGKAISFQDNNYGWKLTYHGHGKAGVPIVENMLDRLGFSNYAIEAAAFATEHHMKFHHILEMKPSKIHRLVSNPYYKVLEVVAWADEFSRGETFMYRGEFKKKMDKIKDLCTRWEARDIPQQRNKIVDGNHVMRLTGMKPGPQLGQVIKKAETRILDEDIDPNGAKADELIMEIYHEVEDR